MKTRRCVLVSMLSGMLSACGGNPTPLGPAPASEVAAVAGTARPADCYDRGDDHRDEHRPGSIRHVLLISVDGLHESDASGFIARHPASALASLAERGVQYADARTPTPSDSFPGLVALVTGGTPKTTGVYYDDSYDRTLFPPGSNCAGNPGTECTYFEILNQDFTQLFSPINPANLPMRKTPEGRCNPVFPHEFIQVNTLFEVVHAAGGYTAWADKHPAYDLVNGPSGQGVDELYTPEINSLIVNGGVVNGVDLTGSLALCDGVTNSLPLAKVSDYTNCEPSVMAYDDVKVQAVINEIDGKTADGARRAPVPTVLGMNFQQVSVGQKLPVGGYVDAAGTPSPLLEGALEHVDASLGRMVAALKARGLEKSTLIVVTAKHGQSPIDRTKLAMEPGGRGNATVSDPLAFVNAADPTVSNVFAAYVNPNDGSSPVVSGWLMADDAGLLWLQNQSTTNIANVVTQLTSPTNAAAMFANVLPPGTVFAANINFGPQLSALFGDPTSADPVAAARAPNVFIQPNSGVIYAGSSKKIAEHGGGTLDDTRVALIVSHPGFHARTIHAPVWTKQVAPTILRALDLDPDALQAVVKEQTQVLPGLPL
jgi:hypothetical protein